MLIADQHQTVHVHPRHNGLPGLALGGYVAGLLAAAIDGSAEVKLRRPVQTPGALSIASSDSGWLELRDEETAYAFGRAAELELEVPEPPSADEAAAAATRFRGHHHHPYPDCYACGPDREHGEGLRVFPGSVAGRAMVAAPWTPRAEPGGIVPVEEIWAAFDCVQLWALIEHGGGSASERVVTARLAGEMHAPADAGEPHVLYGWPVGRDGDAFLAGAALVDAGGRLLASGLQTAVLAKWGVPLTL